MWVCLQNCHLSQSWMPALDQIIDTIDIEKVNFTNIYMYFYLLIYELLYYIINMIIVDNVYSFCSKAIKVIFLINVKLNITSRITLPF